MRERVKQELCAREIWEERPEVKVGIKWDERESKVGIMCNEREIWKKRPEVKQEWCGMKEKSVRGTKVTIE